MSYTIALHCGCIVYVSCHPATHCAHTRIIESVGARCTNRRHERGARVSVWELLPERAEDDVANAPSNAVATNSE